MKSNIQFYACEWNPNGTNDLLVVDGDSFKVLDVIPEALFGFKRTGFWNSLMKTCKACIGDDLVYLRSSDEYIPGEMCMVGRISRRDIFKYIACSPLDPEGKEVIARIKEVA